MIHILSYFSVFYSEYIMYNYPLFSDLFKELVPTSPLNHSMGESLKMYLELKIHPYILSHEFDEIRVIGQFDRSEGVSPKEKNGKLFNWIRPTAVLKDHVLELRCFPGMDYVYHYANIVKTYTSLYFGEKIKISYSIPTEKDCWFAIKNSALNNIPKVKTVIMGYVEGLDFLSDDISWHGENMFMYKHISDDAILLGCKHTYWGEIAGRIVAFLSTLGIKQIIYAGKLGSLDASITSNGYIATGDTSILPNGQIIKWENIFSIVHHSLVLPGIHITLPSVLQETKEWVGCNKKFARYVDPEIGHMAYAAKNYGVQFSYLHIISDNLSCKYHEDLSNERNDSVRQKRKKLLNVIGESIKLVLNA